MNYNLDKFKKDFIDTADNFDEMLIQQNNELVNSNNHYIQYKNQYIIKTNSCYKNFSKLYDKYNIYMNNYIKDDKNKKYIYTYVNKETLHSINEELKNILIEQRKLYITFIDYINFLNKIIG